MARPAPLAELKCERQAYAGIEHCTLGSMHILRIDPQAVGVRFETVLPRGYDREGTYGECRDVNTPRNSTGPGCELGGRYPLETVARMAARYRGAVAAINGDFYGTASGAIGLTVKNGQRLDGLYGDDDGNEVRRCSLSISSDGEVRIGVVDRATLPDPAHPERWRPDPVAYYTSISGGPLLVHAGERVALHGQCMAEGSRNWHGCPPSQKECTWRRLRDAGKCASPYVRRARTGVGTTADGLLILLVAPESAGLTLPELAGTLMSLGAVEAMGLDGGGSSQMWYRGRTLVSSGRAVAEGLLVLVEQ